MLLLQWHFSMPGKSTAVELCWLYVRFVPGGTTHVGPRCCCSEFGHCVLNCWFDQQGFESGRTCIYFTLAPALSYVGWQQKIIWIIFAAHHFNKHRFAGQQSPELCNALTVFMATSKDLQSSDCHNELVISSRGKKEKQTKPMLH